MKNLLYTLFIFLILPFTGLTQNDIVNKDEYQPAFKNQIDLDVELLSFSFGYKRRISEKWLVGANLGVGPSLRFIKEFGRSTIFHKNVAIELVHIGISFKYYQSKKLQFEIEPRYYSLADFATIGGEGQYGSNLFGVGYGFYYGKKIQVGFNLMVNFVDVNMSTSDRYTFLYPPVLTSSLLILRIPIKW